MLLFLLSCWKSHCFAFSVFFLSFFLQTANIYCFWRCRRARCFRRRRSKSTSNGWCICLMESVPEREEKCVGGGNANFCLYCCFPHHLVFRWQIPRWSFTLALTFCHNGATNLYQFYTDFITQNTKLKSGFLKSPGESAWSPPRRIKDDDVERLQSG